MNKRSFFKSLALLASGAAIAPGIFVPKFEPVRWKIIRPNPDWQTAEYKVYFFAAPAILDEMIFYPKDYCGKWQFVMEGKAI